MTRKTLFSIVALIVAINLSIGQSANSETEIQQIRTTLMHYIEGTANGQPDRLRKAFHPGFNLYTVTQEDSLRIISGQRYISNIKEGEKNSRQGRILSVDYDGESAIAKAEIVIPGYRIFTDYFILSKYEGSWKIVHKSFSSRTDNIAERPVENAQLDEIFAEFDNPNRPALSALIMHNGEVVFKKAFGSADLDTKTPATLDTKFQLGGLSKHFTAFAIFLLEERGLLSFSDEIGKYFPDFPKYSPAITIDHLLTQTSGLPDFWTLKNIAGWHRDDVFTQAHALQIIKNAKPGYEPGEDYIYSNTDQLLLAEIVARVSKKSFATFMKEEVFEPVGMINSVIVDDFEAYVPNVAESYEPSGESFKRSALNYSIVGPTNMYSTVNDLAKWEMHLQNPVVGSKEMITKLYRDAQLNNGEVMEDLAGRLNYSQQLNHKERGIMNYYQMGTLGGYASSIFKFAESDFTTIVLSSGVPYNGYLGIESAYILIEDEFTEPRSFDYENMQIKKLKQKQLEAHTGIYWNEKSGYSREIELKDDTLRYVRTWGGRESTLIPLTNDEFQMMSPGDEKISATFSEVNGQKQMAFVIGESDPVISVLKPSYSVTSRDLGTFEGTYYCESLNVTYNLAIEDGVLVANSLKSPQIRFNPIEKNVFEASQWYIGGIRFADNKTGFTVQNDQVSGLWFEKMD